MLIKLLALSIFINVVIINITLAQSHLVRLTDDPSLDAYPSFCPDNSRIYFLSDRTTSKGVINGSIWSMNINGDDEKEIIRVIKQEGGTVFPTVGFTKDAQNIIFLEVNGLWEVLTIDINNVKTFPLFKNNPSGSEGLFRQLMKVGGQTCTSNPIYNPISKKVTWVSQSNSLGYDLGHYFIRTIELDKLNGQYSVSTGVEVFQTSPKGIIHILGHPICISPDGTKIVASILMDTTNCSKCKNDFYEIDILRGTVTRLTTDGEKGVTHEDPVWSPDGQWIVFSSNSQGLSSIWVMKPDGSDMKRITSDTTFDYAPYWSADSKKIAFTSIKDKNHDIYMVDFDQCYNKINYQQGFNTINKLNFINNASHNIANNSIALTDAGYWQSGALWYSDKLSLKDGFTCEFSFRLTEGANKYTHEVYPGADGICFVIQNHKETAMGSPGGSIGFKNIQNSIVVEFDTFKNADDNDENKHDPNENHAAIFCNGTNPNSPNHSLPSNLITNDSIMTLFTDGRTFFCKIEYEPKNFFKVYLDTTDAFLLPDIMNIPGFDITQMISFDKGEFGWVGFTSATGNAYERHEILTWLFCTNSSNILDVNDKQSDNEEEQVSVTPNPFSDYTTLNVKLKHPCQISFYLFNVLGKKIMESKEEMRGIGDYSISLDCSKLYSGIYYYSLIMGDTSYAGKMVLIK